MDRILFVSRRRLSRVCGADSYRKPVQAYDTLELLPSVRPVSQGVHSIATLLGGFDQFADLNIG
jgi:hypothetical protein